MLRKKWEASVPLTQLDLFRTKVSDLASLQGMPLERLVLAHSDVADISALRGMPLVEVNFWNCTALTDLSPLADCKNLQKVTLPPNAQNFQFLRGFPKLERLSFTQASSRGYGPDKTTAEFWAEFDAKEK